MIRKMKNNILISIIIIILCSMNNVYATENARVFTTNFFPYSMNIDRESAQIGFNKLNYNVSIQNDSTSGAIFAWTNPEGEEYSNNNYAFYITTHGPTNGEAVQGINYIRGENGEKIYPGEISGNWHFVYIDACNSARNDAWPDSLNITGRTNRAFLGWGTDVIVGDSRDFNKYFWREYVTTCPIEQAAANAAAEIPGEGTTPILFAGDGTWYGYAN